MKSNKLKDALIITLLFSVFFVIVGPLKVMGHNEPQIGKSAQGLSDYELRFSATENKLIATNEQQNVYTSLGNPISFSYANYYDSSGSFGLLTEDGFIANDTAISGLTKLTINFGAIGGDLLVSYGWFDNDKNSIVYEVENVVISPSASEFLFDGYKPSFFKIVAFSTSQITAMTLSYSCEETINAFADFKGLGFTKTGDSYIVSSCDLATVSVQIPATYKGLPVTSIGEKAFNNCQQLSSVTIPSSITSIKAYAFAYCFSLTTVNLPSSLTEIGYSAFYYCTSLTGPLTIPSSVSAILPSTFAYCSALTSIVLPTSLISIDEYAFSHCAALTTVTIPATVTHIAAQAFASCTALTEFNIPASVTSIGERVFNRCSSLTAITVAENNTEFVALNGALYTKDFKTLLAAPGAIVQVTIPSGVETIKFAAFADCEQLTSVEMPSSLTTIESSAFTHCKALVTINFPSSLTSLGTNAFSYCSALPAIVIPSSLTTIEGYTFAYCEALTSVVLPPSITLIGTNAFANCRALVTVAIPNSVEAIYEYAFAYCDALTMIAIPASVTSMRYNVFYNSNLVSIRCEALSKPLGWDINWNIGNRPVVWGLSTRGSLTSNGFTTNAIAWSTINATMVLWTGLTPTLDIPQMINGYVVNMISSTFTNYSTAEYVRIPDSVITVAADSFQNMTELKTLIIGSGVISIGENAFLNSLPNSENLTIYFKGSAAEWQNIGFAYFENNGYSVALYSAEEPSSYDTIYWHYAEDGMSPLLWE